MKPFSGSAPLAWIAAAAFAFAAAWPHLSGAPLPLLGLRNLTVPSVGWPAALAALAMAVFLSIPAMLTRERSLICAGFSFCLFVVFVYCVSPVAAGIFLFIGVHLVRDARRAASARPEGAGGADAAP